MGFLRVWVALVHGSDGRVRWGGKFCGCVGEGGKGESLYGMTLVAKQSREFGLRSLGVGNSEGDGWSGSFLECGVGNLEKECLSGQIPGPEKQLWHGGLSNCRLQPRNYQGSEHDGLETLYYYSEPEKEKKKPVTSALLLEQAPLAPT